jgi:hypothetical protein
VRSVGALITILASVVIGCGDDGSGGDGTCNPTTDCADGSSCSITHTEDGSGECLADDGDIDADGLLNKEDYCNAGEGGQWDEDRDLIGDDCDRCPIAPPEGADADDDEVDSPCDPDPGEPGDKIVVFDGFRNGLNPAWVKTGAWTAEFGDAIVTPDADSVATMTSALPLITQDLAVLVQYRIDEVPSVPRSYVGLIARDNRPASSALTRCGGQRSNAQDSMFLETETQAEGVSVPNAFNSASLYSVALRVEGLTSACAMIADETQVATQVTSSGEQLSAAGLFVQGATARFQYLLVIQRDTSSRLD